MLKAGKLWPKSKLGWWLAIIFAVIVVGAAAGGILLYRNQAAGLQATEARTLESIAALKVAQIADWRSERLFDAGVLTSSALLRSHAEEWLQTRSPAHEAALLASLRSYLSQGRYANALLVDADGAPLLVADADQPVQLCPTTPAQVAEALSQRTIVFGDIQRCGPAGELRLQMVAPLLGAGAETGAPPGAVILSIDPADFLFPYIQTWPVPSNTAETLLVRRDGENVVYLNELRHRTGTALNLQFPVGNALLPAAVAVMGQERTMIGKDYRGQEVLAVTRSVPGSNWHLVAKADTAELFAGLTGDAYRFAFTVLGLIALAAVTVGLVFNREQSDSLRQLYAAQRARQIVLERFAALVQSAPDAILLLDADGRIKEANPQAATLFGLGSSELEGQMLVSLGDSTAGDAWRAGFVAAAAGSVTRFEYRLGGRTGRATPVEANVNRVYLDDVLHFQAILRDISERRRAEAALRASEEKFRVLFSELNVGIVVHGADTRILYSNPTSQRLLAMTPDQMAGRVAADPAWHFVQSNGEVLQVDDYPVNRVLATGAPFQDYLVGIVAAAGARPVWVLVDAFPLWDGDQVREVVVTFVDVTAREQAQAERAQLLLELQLKNRDLENVVYVASHDLRSPLVNIQGFGQRLQTDIHKVDKIIADSPDLEALRAAVAPLLVERIPNALRYIAASGAKMDALINGLLRLSRAGRAELRLGSVDMNAMLAAIVTTLAYQLEKAGAQVQVDDLPPCWGDADQLNQVFSNLLDNAIKYRDPNRPLHIQVSGQQRRNVVTYQVADTGRGIPVEHQDHIWEIFHRLDPDGAIPGEGLGLTLTRRITERQNGKIRVESQPGIGSTFYVALPATAPERAQPAS